MASAADIRSYTVAEVRADRLRAIEGGIVVRLYGQGVDARLQGETISAPDEGAAMRIGRDWNRTGVMRHDTADIETGHTRRPPGLSRLTCVNHEVNSIWSTGNLVRSEPDRGPHALILPRARGAAREAAIDHLLQQEMYEEAVLDRALRGLDHAASATGKFMFTRIAPVILVLLALNHWFPR